MPWPGLTASDPPAQSSCQPPTPNRHPLAAALWKQMEGTPRAAGWGWAPTPWRIAQLRGPCFCSQAAQG